METFFKIAGVICLILGLIGFVMLGLSVLIEIVNKFRDRWRWDAEELIRRDVGKELVTYSWWFSEQPSVMFGIRALGEHYSRNGRIDISVARESWRSELDLLRMEITKTHGGKANGEKSN